MAFFQAVLLIVKNMPAIMQLVSKLAEAVKAGVHIVEVKIELKKFDDAAQKSEQEKDTSDLEKLFNP